VGLGIVRKASRYPWSSAAQHCGRTTGDGSPDWAAWREMLGKHDWIDVLTEVPDETETRGLRLNTHTGRPLRSDGVVGKRETFLIRRPRPLPVGRPNSRKDK